MMSAIQNGADNVQRTYPGVEMYLGIDDLDLALSFIDIYLTANHCEDRRLYMKVVVLENKGRLQGAILVYSNLIYNG